MATPFTGLFSFNEAAPSAQLAERPNQFGGFGSSYGPFPAPAQSSPSVLGAQTSQNQSREVMSRDTSTRTSRGGGGGGTPPPAPEPQQPSGPSDAERRAREAQEAINREIENIFGASNQYLGQAEQNIRNDLPRTLEEIQAQFGAGQQQLETGKAQSERQLDETAQATRQRSQESEADARRLFNELQLGGQQRFGGASSAGQAFSEIANVEQQRRAGAIARDFNTAMREIEDQRLNVQENYQDNLRQLKVQRDQSVNQANRDFQNKLLQISQMRAANDQAKAEARLGALQDLRNQIFQIDLQNQQFQQQLEAQRQANELALQNYAQQVAASTAGGQSAFDQFAGQTQNQSTILNPGAGMGGGQGFQTPTGAVNRRDDEGLIGALGPNFNFTRNLTDRFGTGANL